MRAPKFTPGPWSWDGPVWGYDPSNEAPWLVGEAPDGSRIEPRILHGEIKCDNEADAHLIAAAPEMFEACRTLATYYMGHEPTGDMAAKEAGSGVYQALVLARAALAKAVPQ